jgi:hypothetical protein
MARDMEITGAKIGVDVRLQNGRAGSVNVADAREVILGAFGTLDFYLGCNANYIASRQSLDELLLPWDMIGEPFRSRADCNDTYRTQMPSDVEISISYGLGPGPDAKASMLDIMLDPRSTRMSYSGKEDIDLKGIMKAGIDYENGMLRLFLTRGADPEALIRTMEEHSGIILEKTEGKENMYHGLIPPGMGLNLSYGNQR